MMVVVVVVVTDKLLLQNLVCSFPRLIFFAFAFAFKTKIKGKKFSNYYRRNFYYQKNFENKNLFLKIELKLFQTDQL